MVEAVYWFELFPQFVYFVQKFIVVVQFYQEVVDFINQRVSFDAENVAGFLQSFGGLLQVKKVWNNVNLMMSTIISTLSILFVALNVGKFVKFVKLRLATKNIFTSGVENNSSPQDRMDVKIDKNLCFYFPYPLKESIYFTFLVILTRFSSFI